MIEIHNQQPKWYSRKMSCLRPYLVFILLSSDPSNYTLHRDYKRSCYLIRTSNAPLNWLKRWRAFRSRLKDFIGQNVITSTWNTIIHDYGIGFFGIDFIASAVHKRPRWITSFIKYMRVCIKHESCIIWQFADGLSLPILIWDSLSII